MKTFLLCLGAHKAGTTWLHRELSRQSFSDFGALKEYHVFDARQDENQGPNFFRRTLVERAGRLLKKHGDTLDPSANPNVWMKMAFQAKPELYYSYLDGRLNLNSQACLTGDFTPNYSSLSTETMSVIRTELVRRGFSVRVLFLMRDPVERCWSMERSRPSRAEEDPSDHLVRESWERALLMNFASKSMEKRTQYDRIVARMRRAFSPQEIRCELHETLFRQHSIDRLCHWLGVPRFQARVSTKVNKSAKGDQLSDATVKAITTHYSPAYRIAREIFGAEVIAEHWPSSHWVPET